MQTFLNQKVAIIGAGICGLYLGWKLSRKGYRITIFEQKRRVGQKPCSGLISERLNNFIPLNQDLIENKINACLLYFPKKTITLKLKPAHLVINKRKVEENLFYLAQESGVKIIFNQTIKEIPSGFDKVIGCDGAISKIRENLSLPKPAFRLGLQAFTETKDSSDIVETCPHRAGFFWKIPRGSRTEYGAIGSLKTIKSDFEFFCQRERINIAGGQIRSALIPQGLIIPQDRNITLCGDAVGLTKPWSGGGVIWGLTAAEILLKNFPDFKKYQKELKRFFRPKILKGEIAAFLVYFLGNNFFYILPSKMSRDNDFPVF
jgi:flavin-dependent dehydrogenase